MEELRQHSAQEKKVVYKEGINSIGIFQRPRGELRMKYIKFDDLQNETSLTPSLFNEWTVGMLQEQKTYLVPCKISIPYYDGEGFF